MAVNETRSMNGEMHQGVVDNTYISIAPNRGGVLSAPPTERLTWPQYRNAEQFIDHAFDESAAGRAHLPRERKTAAAGDFRY